MLIFITAALILIAELLRHGGLWSHVAAWVDNPSYIGAASAIASRSSAAWWHFLGLPMAIAAVSKISPLTEIQSLFAVSMSSALLATLLICRLYGSAVAAAFTVLSWEWLQTSVLGGSETLFTALLLAAFLAARKQRWLLAAVLASFATTVRPVGIFALLALAIVLSIERRWKPLWIASASSLIIGVGYLWFAQRVAGDAFFNFKLYRNDWDTGFPLTFPFKMLVVGGGQMLSTMPWTAALECSLWFILSMVLVTAAFRKRKQLFKLYPLETLARGGISAVLPLLQLSRRDDGLAAFPAANYV